MFVENLFVVDKYFSPLVITFSFFALNIVKLSALYLPLIVNLVSLIVLIQSQFFCHRIFVSLLSPVSYLKLLHSVRLNCCNLLCVNITVLLDQMQLTASCADFTLYVFKSLINLNLKLVILNYSAIVVFVSLTMETKITYHRF